MLRLVTLVPKVSAFFEFLWERRTLEGDLNLNLLLLLLLLLFELKRKSLSNFSRRHQCFDSSGRATRWKALTQTHTSSSSPLFFFFFSFFIYYAARARARAAERVCVCVCLCLRHPCSDLIVKNSLARFLFLFSLVSFLLKRKEKKFNGRWVVGFLWLWFFFGRAPHGVFRRRAHSINDHRICIVI